MSVQFVKKISMSTCTVRSQIFVYLALPMEYYLLLLFARRKSAFLFKLLLLYSVICLNTPYNISTCDFLKSWSVQFKSNGLNFSFVFEKLSINEIEQSTGERLTLLRCWFIFSFLSMVDGR